MASITSRRGKESRMVLGLDNLQPHVQVLVRHRGSERRCPHLSLAAYAASSQQWLGTFPSPEAGAPSSAEARAVLRVLSVSWISPAKPGAAWPGLSTLFQVNSKLVCARAKKMESVESQVCVSRAPLLNEQSTATFTASSRIET